MTYERVASDLEGVVPEIEALELGAERGRRPLRLSMADLLHALDGLSLLLPELAGLTALAVGEREDARRVPIRCRDRDRAARAPDEVGGVSADHEELSCHAAAPASRLDCPTISSRTSSSSNPPPSKRSAQSASPSSTGG